MDLSIFVYHRCQQNHDSTRRLKRIALSFKQAEAQASSAFTFDSMLRMERTFFDSPAQNVSQDSISINENKTYDNYERKTLVRRAMFKAGLQAITGNEHVVESTVASNSAQGGKDGDDGIDKAGTHNDGKYEHGEEQDEKEDGDDGINEAGTHNDGKYEHGEKQIDKEDGNDGASI